MGLHKYNWIMKAGVLSAFALATAGTQGNAQPVVPCPAPIAHCVHEVSGWCEKDNGKIIIVYYDKSFSAERYQQCLGKVLEKHGRPNPYAPPSQQKQQPKR